MAILNDDQRKMMIGAALGVVAVSAVRAVFPFFAGLGRPLLKATIKSSIVLYERGREATAHFAETVEDLVAEVKSEMEQEIEAPAESTQAHSSEPQQGPVQ